MPRRHATIAARIANFAFARIVLVGVLLPSTVVIASAAEDNATWRAGVARANITPQQPMWMSGYASRDRPAEGKLTDLWAKALVLEDSDGRRAMIITLDLVGIGAELSNAIRDELQSEYALTRDQVALNCSHTHTGPVVANNLRPMYFFDNEQDQLVAEYTEQLQSAVVRVAGEALANLQPASITYGQGRATFAVNRRNNREADVPKLREQNALVGPTDHDVPVLHVADADGHTTAILFGYACHATVLSSYEWSGDYPGFAQIDLEAKHPGAIALFWAGCGADQNPLPRRSVELAKDYGRQLAKAVDKVLAEDMTPLTGALRTEYVEVDLPFDTLPTREELEEQTQSDNRYYVSRAKMLLARLDAGEKLSPTYPYPISVWHLGPELRFIALGGEVVVDYALRLKAELGETNTWVAGYTNDVMAYIPSRRVLIEGGYEGSGAMVYYGLPTTWAPEVEETIIHAVRNLAKREK